MVDFNPRWKQLWDTWDLRVFIVLSISLQMFLILVSPLRKRIKSNWIVMPLWSAYLLADWAANFAVGLISNSQGNSSGGTPTETEDIVAFWAPFLLVHLGGPDTITAFALEDNELWLRHLLGLVFQCIAAVYVFAQSLPKNRLWIPTLLMFLTGVIKYAERTRALYLASADKFKESMLTDPESGPDYAKLMYEYSSKKEAKLPTRIQMVSEPNRQNKALNKAKKGYLTELEVVQYAYQFFETFKGLVVDMILSRRERNQSRAFFLNRTAKDAFKVVEVELNFMYEVLFTKLPVVYGGIGVISRIVSLGTVCASIVLFIFMNKSKFDTADVTITFGLLFGALTLDLTSLFMLLFSDWTIIYLRKSPEVELAKSFKNGIITPFLRVMTDSESRKWPIQILKRRWSESVSTYNLIYFVLNPHPGFWQSLFNKLGLIDSLRKLGLFHEKPKKFTDELREFIFKELKSKSELADDLETANEINSAHGDWVIRVEAGWVDLLPYVQDLDYDQCLIQWHIATELCFNKELGHDSFNFNDHRENAKMLSDYMLYLLIMQPGLMSEIAGIGQIRFRDTCEEAKRFFANGKRSDQKRTRIFKDTNVFRKQIKACMDILDVPTEVKPVTVKGARSKSLLFDGCILAKELMRIEEESGKKLDKWLIISKVWVELLCYAASHSRANSQAAQVSKGGELITIVWLLMAHLGLSDQFQVNEGQARAKLIVGK